MFAWNSIVAAAAVAQTGGDGSIVAGAAVAAVGVIVAVIRKKKALRAYRERAAAAAPAPAGEAPASAPAPVAPSASAARPATAAAPTGEVELSGVSEREAAMIMAIVANAIGKPPAQLRFHSIKEVKRP